MSHLTLNEIRAASRLAEVQNVTQPELDLAESIMLGLFEAFCGCRLTADAAATSTSLTGSGLGLLYLHERVEELVAVHTPEAGDITSSVSLIPESDGWLLRRAGLSVFEVGDPVTVTARYGRPLEGTLRSLLTLGVVNYLVRDADPVTRRDEVTPWGSLRDGDVSVSRDTARDRDTAAGRIPHDIQLALSRYRRPSFVAVV